ncbi:MAG TPA: primosomal protein N', partial [Phycisphaerales bacterium]|nr:primosomal protein N' [Phycisphaerales bacterium]
MGRSLFTQDEAPLTGRYAKVVLERGIDDPDGLTYAIPVSMREVEVGQRVTAPLGRGNRPVPGYVVEIVTQPGLDPDRIKPLASRAGSSLPAPLVQLARWMARYYCCPIGMVLATMVPAAVKHRTGLVKRTLLQRVAGGVNPDELTPATRKAADALATIVPSDFPLAARDLAAKLGAKTVAVVNRLVKAGLLTPIETREVRVSRSSWAEVPLDHHSRPAPTAAQRKAIESIAGAAGRFAPFVLFGVTGSGKTEVYLGAIERVLARGEGAIVLVPEISLTPQTAGRFLARFGAESVAILHSGLTQSQRHDAWSRVARGEARIVVGARSAVFAPFETAKIKLGLIVVDEEHDHSYKQDQLPRYHARDVAIKRAQLEGCPVVLGSATPSLESWLNATGPGGGGAAESEHPAHRFTLLELPDRVGGGTLPRVDIVDIAEERRERPRSDRLQHSVGPKLELALERTLERGGQAILLLNRRGFSSYICCVDATCGWYMTCDHCDVTVVFHKKQSRFGGPVKREGFVRCHHCLAQQKLPELCPRCSKRINTFGFGTQRLEEELERKFPALRIGST